MLSCGRSWQPQLIRRVINALPTSTDVVQVSTDQGIGFLKGIGNPAGTDSLANELVAAELARWLGLEIPDFAVVDLQGITIDLAKGGQLASGPAFISRQIESVPFDGTDTMLGKLRDQKQVSQFVVFDTWIRNGDRHHPDENLGQVNRDNLFFTPSGRNYNMVAIDHSHCFVEGSLETDLGDDGVIADDAVYGLFPEFVPFVDPAAIAETAARLRTIDTAVAREIVASIPPEWGPTTQLRNRWADVICRRAEHVSRLMEATFVEQPRLGI